MPAREPEKRSINSDKVRYLIIELSYIHPTTELILRDIAQILTKAVTKTNYVVKCTTIKGGSHFIYGGTKNDIY
jgi:hypothetical protein